MTNFNPFGITSISNEREVLRMLWLVINLVNLVIGMLLFFIAFISIMPDTLIIFDIAIAFAFYYFIVFIVFTVIKKITENVKK